MLSLAGLGLGEGAKGRRDHRSRDKPIYTDAILSL